MALIPLDDVNTDDGCIQRLLLAEARGPKASGYDFDETKTVIQAMIAVLQNRVGYNSPSKFCAPRGSSLRMNYVTAVCAGGAQQFRGFSLDSNGDVAIAQPQLDTINGILTLAQQGDTDCVSHINMIVGYSKSSVADPYSGIPSVIDGNQVLRGVYGWRTAGSGTGGGTYVQIPAGNNPSGVLQGIQFTTIIDESSARQIRALIDQLTALSNVRSFIGYQTPDHNFNGRILIIQDIDEFYSVNKTDILNEILLPDGRYLIDVRRQSIGLKVRPFIIGKDGSSLLDLTDHLIPPLPDMSNNASSYDIARINESNPLAKSLSSVAANWTNACDLGMTPPNNCAHYLSNAFIKAGYTELLRKNSEGLGIFNAWCDSLATPPNKNDNARPIRAKEMWTWFKQMKTSEQTTIPSNQGFWAVFQWDPSYSGGHVLVYDSNTKLVYGTGAYWGWQNQYFYKW